MGSLMAEESAPVMMHTEIQVAQRSAAQRSPSCAVNLWPKTRVIAEAEAEAEREKKGQRKGCLICLRLR